MGVTEPNLKKAIFFDPYLDAFGGGERYFLTLVSFLAAKGIEVDVLWPETDLAKKINNTFAIKFKRVNFIPCKLSELNILEKLKLLRKYDLSFYLSDGSIPFLFAKKNFLHFQVPFHGVGGRSFFNRIKIKNIDWVVCNSFFTKRFIDKEYGINSSVIYPPVAVEKFKSGKKENIILSVARFTDLLHSKRQDILVKAFKKLIGSKKTGWRLVLAGGDKEGKELVKKIKEESQGYPIEIITNPTFSQLQSIYSKAKIFWSATGFGVDENKNPEAVEHFGITTVEAMAAGCVPVVINQGGQKEIIQSDIDGFLWQTPEELIKLSQGLIEDQKYWHKISWAAVKKSQKFSENKFYQEYEKIIKTIS